MSPRLRMQARLLIAALTRRRGMVALAVLAVAIGTSVAAALLHVSADVSRKLTRELRVLGPNLILVSDEAGAQSSGGYLDESAARARLAAAGLTGAPQLEAVARSGGAPLRLVGADLAALRSLHPSWSLPADPGGAWIGERLARRLGARAGDHIEVAVPATRLSAAFTIGAVLAAGGEDDETLFAPLADVQALAGLPGRLSAVAIRVAGDARDAREAARALEAGGGMRALLLHELSETEANLLGRMRRLMALVTIAALISAGLCAFGTLTDLALERRREIALLKALGASRREIVRQFAVESVAIGLLGGAAGWLIGVFFAEVIGHQVFHSAVTLRADVPLIVLGLAVAVAVGAGLGPIRYALSIDPAAALKGD